MIDEYEKKKNPSKIVQYFMAIWGHNKMKHNHLKT